MAKSTDKGYESRPANPYQQKTDQKVDYKDLLLNPDKCHSYLFVGARMDKEKRQ